MGVVLCAVLSLILNSRVRLEAAEVVWGEVAPYLTWAPSADTNVAGYYVKYGIVGSASTNVFDAHTSNFAELSWLEREATNFVFVTAYDGLGKESAPSSMLYYAYNTTSGDPHIVEDPKDIIATINNTATVMVTASGTPPLTYRWFKDGEVVTGAGEFTYVIANVQAGDAGSYYVEVSNARGKTVSRSATLSLLPGVAEKPVITPAGGLVNEDMPISLRCDNAGSSTFYRVDNHPSQLYLEPIKLAAGSHTVEAYSVVSGCATSDLASVSFLVQALSAVPVFSPAAGLIDSSAGIALTCATLGANITYFIDDGPANYYSGPFELSPGEHRLRALATCAGYTPSAEVATSFTVSRRNGLTVVPVVIIRDTAASLRFSGFLGRQYTIQTSVNLREWITLDVQRPLVSGSCEFVDRETTFNQQRFYRVLDSAVTLPVEAL